MILRLLFWSAAKYACEFCRGFHPEPKDQYLVAKLNDPPLEYSAPLDEHNTKNLESIISPDFSLPSILENPDTNSSKSKYSVEASSLPSPVLSLEIIVPA